MLKIDLEQPPTFGVGGLTVKHTQCMTEDNNNEYVGQVQMLWKSIDYLKVVRWRHNCWRTHLGFKSLSQRTVILQMKAKTIGITLSRDYHDIGLHNNWSCTSW